MAPASPRTRFPGFPGPASAPTLVHLLARLAEADAVARPAFSERLGQWLLWTDAAALSAALAAVPGPAAEAPRGPGGAEADLARLRAEWAETLAAHHAEDIAAAPPAGFGPLRRRCLALQQSVAGRIAALRQRLRVRLAAGSAAQARLAALDAVMEDVIGRQAQGLLASVPGLLEQRFERLRTAAPDDAEAPWWPPFCDDLQAVMLAELALRLQPLDGLLAALHAAPVAAPGPFTPPMTTPLSEPAPDAP